MGRLLRGQAGDDRSPIFRQERLGARSVPFSIYKFRTLDSETAKPLGKITGLIRRYGIDELPQAYNIFRNEMSVVAHRSIPGHEQEEVFDNSPGGLVDRWKRIVEPTKSGLFSSFTLYNHSETDKAGTMIERAPMKLEWDIKDVIDGSLIYDMAIIASAFRAAAQGET